MDTRNLKDEARKAANLYPGADNYTKDDEKVTPTMVKEQDEELNCNPNNQGKIV